MAAKKQTAKAVADDSKNAVTVIFDKNTLTRAVEEKEMLKPGEVPLPEMGGVLLVKHMTLGERDEYFAKMAEIDAKVDSGNAQAFARAVINADGSAMFDLKNDEDMETIRNLPPSVVSKVLNKFYEINDFVIAGSKSASERTEDKVKNS